MKDELHYLPDNLWSEIQFLFWSPHIWMRKSHLMHHYPGFRVVGAWLFCWPVTNFCPCNAFADAIYSCQIYFTGRCWYLYPHADVTFVVLTAIICRKFSYPSQLERPTVQLINFLLKCGSIYIWLLKCSSYEFFPDQGLDVSDGRICYCITYDCGVWCHLLCYAGYYRYHVLRTLWITESQLDVLATAGIHCPLRRHYKTSSAAECYRRRKVFSICSAQKISLNIMSWHKGGFTERMANIML